jgi:hypothetical protein
MKIFSELDHRMSVVPRWGILHTLQDQSLAEHVHNVVRITSRIGPMWFNLNHEELLTALMWAHHHDDEESLTGDLPAMVKPYFDEAAFIDEHRDLLQATVLPPEHIVNIVKLADKMEGYHFLRMEWALGNKFIENHLDAEPSIIHEYINKTYGVVHKLHMLFDDWRSNLDTKSTRYSRRGR